MCASVCFPDRFAQAGTRYDDTLTLLALHLNQADTEQVLPLRVPAKIFNKRVRVCCVS